MPDTAIAISQLSKSFQRGSRALSEVSLSVERGEMVALIGASGSGKSTLLRHVSGLAIGDRNGGAASVEILGRAIQSHGRLSREARSIRADVGMVFQQFNLVGRLSVLTNVLLGTLGRIPSWRGTLGLFTAAEKRTAMEALDRVGMARFAGQRASTLSGGQQQRVAIARTLVQKATVVIADEPIASLDPASANKVMETLAAINREDGITVVVSLHQVNYAAKYCPRTVAMRAGQVVHDGPSTALTPAFLTELYGADSEELIVDARPERDLETGPRGAMPEPAFAAG
ncbi:phosphonate ABC transporter ATP-binding protein [Caenispirillum salinarum]|uniref:phosphonate ABC transporter ATP-binding protein n=1 Tax=Caenispirillum salinarum TaxID=859058 RepID=UPI00384D8729